MPICSSTRNISNAYLSTLTPSITPSFPESLWNGTICQTQPWSVPPRAFQDSTRLGQVGLINPASNAYTPHPSGYSSRGVWIIYLNDCELYTSRQDKKPSACPDDWWRIKSHAPTHIRQACMCLIYHIIGMRQLSCDVIWQKASDVTIGKLVKISLRMFLVTYIKRYICEYRDTRQKIHMTPGLRRSTWYRFVWSNHIKQWVASILWH